MVKNLPTMQEIWAQSLSWEDPLEKGMATYSSTLAWRIPWTEEPGRLRVSRKESDMTGQLTLSLFNFSVAGRRVLRDVAGDCQRVKDCIVDH